MPPSSSVPLLSSLLISGEFVPLSGWSLCQSSGWLVERRWANRKAFSHHMFLLDSLIILHDDAAHLNRWHTWLLSDVLHVRRSREQWAGVLQQTSSVFDLFESRQQDLNKGPSRPEPRAPGGSRPVKARMIVESSAGDRSTSESFKPYKTNKMRQCSETESKQCLCTVITQRRRLLLGGCSFRALEVSVVFQFRWS